MNKEGLQLVPGEFVICPIIECSNDTKTNAGEINRFFQELILKFQESFDVLENTVVKIAPIAFNSTAEFYNVEGSNPVEVKDYTYKPLTFGEDADISSAMKLLESKLTTKSRGGWFDSRRPIAPILIFISNGHFEVEYIPKRGWFMAATKLALAFNAPNYESLSKLGGSRETIVYVNTNSGSDAIEKRIINWLVDIIVKYDRTESDRYWNIVLRGEHGSYIIVNKVENYNLFLAVDDEGDIVIIDNLDGQYYIDRDFSEDDLVALKDILSNKDNQINYIFKGGSELFVLWRNIHESKVNCHVIASMKNQKGLSLVLDSTDDLF